MYTVTLTIGAETVSTVRAADASASMVAQQLLMTAQQAIGSGSYGDTPTVVVTLKPVEVTPNA